VKRHCHLIYNDKRTLLQNSQSTEGDVLFRSEYGVPVLWFFAFGARNVYSPGDTVEDRGGEVGNRNPYETQIETAVVRLEQAEGALESDDYLWPLLGAISIFRRKLLSRPKQAFIRVAAPWVIGLDQAQIDRWRAATAFAENCANLISSGRPAEGVRSLAELKPFCPYVPGGHSGDLDDLAKLENFSGESEAMKLALLTLGIPDNREIFEKAVMKELPDKLGLFRALPKREPFKSDSIVMGSTPSKPTETASQKLLGKISSFFGRKGS